MRDPFRSVVFVELAERLFPIRENTFVAPSNLHRSYGGMQALGGSRSLPWLFGPGLWVPPQGAGKAPWGGTYKPKTQRLDVLWTSSGHLVDVSGRPLDISELPLDVSGDISGCL